MKYKYIQLPIYTFIACHFIRKIFKATLTPKSVILRKTQKQKSMFINPGVYPTERLPNGQWLVDANLMGEMQEQGYSFDTVTGQFLKSEADRYNDFMNQLGTVNDMAKIARDRISQGWSPDYEAVPSDGSACPG